MPRFISIMLATLALLALASPSRSSAAEEPFEILTFEPLTGAAAFVGTNMAKAIAAAEELTNRTGGIQGRPVKFVVLDDQSSPQVAVQIMSQFLAKKPSIVIGGTLVSMCNAASGLLKADGPVFWCYTPGVHPPPGSWIFSTGFSTADMFRAGLRYFRDKGYTKLAIISSTDATGQDADRATADELAKPEFAKLTKVAHEHFANADISVTAQLERIRAAGAQAIIAWTTGTPFGTVLRGLQQTGNTVPVLASPSNLVYAQLEGYSSIWPTSPILMPAMPGLVPEAVTDRRVRGAVNQFADAMKASKVDHPDIGELTAWDMLLLVVDAYRKLGTNATPAQMRDYISAVRGRAGIYGMLDFQANPQRGVLPDWITLVRWDPAKGRFFAASKPGGSPL
jgi:branched-chain amino acid transport system substrate-binding protein